MTTRPKFKKGDIVRHKNPFLYKTYGLGIVPETCCDAVDSINVDFYHDGRQGLLKNDITKVKTIRAGLTPEEEFKLNWWINKEIREASQKIALFSDFRQKMLKEGIGD